jgi:hypothetical protein
MKCKQDFSRLSPLISNAAKPGSSKLSNTGAGITGKLVSTGNQGAHTLIGATGFNSSADFRPGGRGKQVILIYFSGMMVFSHSNIIFRAH